MNQQKFIIEKDAEQSQKGKVVWRANFNNKEEAEEWLDYYKISTKTDWIVKDEPLNLQKVVFHKYWLCQLNTKNKVEGSKRDKKCSVRLDIKIKKVNRDTIKNDRKYLQRDVPLAAVITFTGTHSHPTDSCFETLGYLRISEETKLKFYKYFDEGLTPGAAYRMNDMMLRVQPNSGEIRANASLHPPPRTVQYLFDKWRASEYGGAWGCDPFPKLREKIQSYEANGTSIHIDDTDSDCWAVLVVTPIMKRSHELKTAGEIIFTDTTSNVEFTQSNLTVMLTATNGGGIPIAILIHSAQTSECYAKAYSLLKKHFPKCFGGKSGPGIFMTDNCSKEKGALKEVWEEALQYLCHFHIGQSEWRWLREAKHKVPQADQPKLMEILKRIMYAECTEDFEEALCELEECGQENYIKHVKEDLLKKRDEWVKMFRHDIINRGHNTNNLAEATIRILKDIVLTRTKAFNVTAMVEFIANVWEPYFESRLLRYAYGRETAPLHRFEDLSSKMPSDAIERVKHIEGSLYHVPSGNPATPDLLYEVESSVGWCSCPVGRCGAMCKHQALIAEKFGGAFPNLPPINCVGRYQLGRLALGEQCPPFSFFVAVNEEIPQEFQDIQSLYTVANVEIEIIDQSHEPEISNENGSRVETKNDEEMEIDNEGSNHMDLEPVKEDVIAAVRHLMNLGEKGTSDKDSFKRSLQRLAQRCWKAKTPNQATTAVISLSTRANCTSKKSKRINVQPTALARRRPGVSRGHGRVQTGRPPSSQPVAKRSKKAPHKLSLSVARNKSHPKGHGH